MELPSYVQDPNSRNILSLTIPKPLAVNVSITLTACNKASETLGVLSQAQQVMATHSSTSLIQSSLLVQIHPFLDPSYQQQMAQPMYTTFPSIHYGLVSMMVLPTAMEESFMDWYHQILPVLNVNQNITCDWRWLLWEFQGLGLQTWGWRKHMPWSSTYCTTGASVCL